jgi:hypothetical protein
MMRPLVFGAAALTLSAGACRISPGGVPQLRPRTLWLRLHSYGSALRLCRSSLVGTGTHGAAWVRATGLRTTTLRTDSCLPSAARSPAITQRSQSWFRSRFMTTHPVIGGAKDTLLGNLPALPPRGGAALALEDSMTTLKSLMMVSALLVGGAGPFCATANELPDIGGWPPVAAASDPAASIPARTARHHGTRHHRMYMMSVNRTHKGSKLAPASNAKPQMKQ